ncbi:hypothetical protein KAR91_77610, partial [Candidatus Pacearchaeota archaeon]|nr:hypothetical protein [Candidatus Pacearchaeota archaeon]
MAITFSAKYLEEAAKIPNTPDVIVEIELDSGSIKIGEAVPFVGVITALDKPTSFQNKIDPEKGYATLGKLSFQITGRENFKDLVKNEFLKNRRVTKYEGFVADGFTFSDYAKTYTGIISNWSRTGDVLTVTVADDMQPTTKSVPAENETKTQYLDYSNMNPVDMKTNLILTQAVVPPARVDSAQFTSERDLWLAGWKFQRILVKPTKIKELLNELMESTNSFVIHDGELISYKVFSPPVPGQTVVELRDSYEILDNSVSQDSGYLDRFYNRLVIYFDYDESGEDKEKNFDSVYDTNDADSQSGPEWDETTTKRIYSKWIKSHTFDQPATLPIVLYHVSKSNGVSEGKTGHEIKWNGTNKTLSWTSPDGTEGETLTIEEEGRFDLYDADRRKFVRVIVTDFATLDAAGNTTETITITALSGFNYAVTLANKWLNRYRDPVATVPFKVGLNHTSNNGVMWKPTDAFRLTTDDACVKGKDSFNAEPMMLLSVRPDGGSNEIALTSIQTKIYRRYGFIGPASITSDYPDATEAE